MSTVEIVNGETQISIVPEADDTLVVIASDDVAIAIESGEQGPPGIPGPPGAPSMIPGPPGQDGTVMRYGPGDPDSGVGHDGDFYINTTSHFLFGPKAGTWPPGTSLIGPQGPAGAPGNTVLYGSTDPVTATGVAGNFYINTTTHFLFGPKATTWPAGTSMIGPQGPAGPPGSGGGGTSVIVSDTPPVGAPDGTLWWESDSGLLYIRYNDGTSTQWVIAAPQPDTASFVAKTGDTMTGNLVVKNNAATIIVDKLASGNAASISGRNNGLNRWSLFLGDQALETGGNVGSDCQLWTADDAGNPLGQAFSVNRATGLMNVRGDPTAALGVATKQYVDAQAATVLPPIRGYIAGMNVPLASVTQFVPSPGLCCSSDGTTMIASAGISKSLAPWAAGSGAGVGSLDTGTIAPNTWYHVHMIKRMDTGAVDCLLSTSLTAPVMPANYTKRRRISSLRTDASANIVLYQQDGDNFYWVAPFNDLPGNITATPTLRGLTVPPGINVIASLAVSIQFAGGTAIVAYHWDPTIATVAINNSGTLSVTMGLASTTAITVPIRVRTNTSAQIYNQSSGPFSSYNGFTDSYIDKRGRDD